MVARTESGLSKLGALLGILVMIIALISTVQLAICTGRLWRIEALNELTARPMGGYKLILCKSPDSLVAKCMIVLMVFSRSSGEGGTPPNNGGDFVSFCKCKFTDSQS